MSQKERTTDEGRRNFLKLGAVSAPAAAALMAGSEGAEAAELQDAGEGLRKTPHVKAYLDSARF